MALDNGKFIVEVHTPKGWEIVDEYTVRSKALRRWAHLVNLLNSLPDTCGFGEVRFTYVPNISHDWTGR